MLSKYDLVCFDMDGTLTTVRSTWKWIHECLGTSNEEGYREFLAQRITEKEFMRSDIATWKSVKPDLCRKDLIGIFQRVPLIDGIQETVAALQDCGMTCVIVSGGIDIAAEMLKNEFGFDDCTKYSVKILCVDTPRFFFFWAISKFWLSLVGIPSLKIIVTSLSVSCALSTR